MILDQRATGQQIHAGYNEIAPQQARVQNIPAEQRSNHGKMFRLYQRHLSATASAAEARSTGARRFGRRKIPSTLPERT